MAIFGNFKGTTQSEFKIGKSTGNKIITGEISSQGTYESGDIHLDPNNSTIQVFTGSVWQNVGNTLTDLNVDNGTLVVNSINDTVSIGSSNSNEKLFVNGNIRLGVNPSIKYSGAYLDLQHSNGTGTTIRVRDNSGNTAPVFKVYGANNSSEVFKVQGNTTNLVDLVASTVTSSVTGDVTGNLTGNVTGTVSDISNHDTDDLAEGSSNLYYTDDRANSAIDTKLQGDVKVGSLTADKVSTGVVSGVLFEPITDYGSVVDNANIVIDYGVVTETATTGDFEYLSDTFGPTSDEFSVASLPDATVPGQMIYVGDETGGPVMAFSDGSNWRRITDRLVVS
jgi:hypothetical protein